MATFTITINYAPGAVTPAIQNLVKSIFAACFLSLQVDTVVIVWLPGLVPKNTLGKSGLTWNINLDNTLPPTVLGFVSNALTGGNTVNLCPANIIGSSTTPSATAGGGNVTATTANTVAHEIGIHVLAGVTGHPTPENPWDLSNPSCTAQQTFAPGTWSLDICTKMKNKIGVR